jgi:DHA1 family tetracycline resistance protein-like MFS transporter
MRQVPKKLFPLFLVILFDQTSLSIMFPVLTFIFFDKSSALFSPDTTHATRSLLYGVCISLANLSSIIVAPLLSLLSDNYGRKKILLISTLGAFTFALFSTLGVLYGILWLVLAGKFISGLCSSTDPVAQAIVGDLVEKDNKVLHMGHLQFIISVGAFIGPVIGGYFAKAWLFSSLNFSVPFLIAAAFAVIATLITSIFFKETFRPKEQHPLQLKQTFSLLRNPIILQISITLLLMQISWSTYYQFIPPLLKTSFYFNSTQTGLFVGLIAFWLAIASTIILGLVKNRYTHHQLIKYSTHLMFIGFCTIFISVIFSHNHFSAMLLWLSGALIPIGDVIGYCAITTLYSNAVSAEDQGKAMGLCFVIVAITWTGTALGGGALAALHISLPLLCAPCGIISLLILNQRKSVPTEVSSS